MDRTLMFRLGCPALAAMSLELQNKGRSKEKRDMGNRPEDLWAPLSLNRGLLGIRECMNLTFRVSMKCIC